MRPTARWAVLLAMLCLAACQRPHPAPPSPQDMAMGSPAARVTVIEGEDPRRILELAASAVLAARKIETIMLMGDSPAAAQSVGRRLGIVRVLAEATPEAKLAEIKRAPWRRPQAPGTAPQHRPKAASPDCR